MLTIVPRRVLLAAALLSATFLGAHAQAQAQAPAWPAKPIHMIVPFAPGGGVDIMARAVAAELQEKWKQPIIIDNKAGAGSLLGADFVAKAPADGYTLMATVNQTVVGNRFLYKSLPYDPDKSFEPIMMMVNSDQMIIANASFPGNNVKDILALARKEPGKLSYGSYGVGSQPHLLYETLKSKESVDILHVPYKGITPVLQALAGGEVMLGTGSIAVAAPLIAAGRIKPISIAGPRRLAQYPDVPTTVEQGYPYLQTSIWYGLFAPAGTPAAIVDKIRTDVRAVLMDPVFVEKQATSKGLTVVAGDGDQLRKTIKDEVQVTGEQIKAAGVTAE